MSNFHVGQKVVMINGFGPKETERAASEGVTLPTVGTVYTVRGIEPGLGWKVGYHFIWLSELRNKPCSDGVEPNWDTMLFRPVVERKTDISVFTALLTPSKSKVQA